MACIMGCTLLEVLNRARENIKYRYPKFDVGGGPDCCYCKCGSPVDRGENGSNQLYYYYYYKGPWWLGQVTTMCDSVASSRMCDHPGSRPPHTLPHIKNTCSNLNPPTHPVSPCSRRSKKDVADFFLLGLDIPVHLYY